MRTTSCCSTSGENGCGSGEGTPGIFPSATRRPYALPRSFVFNSARSFRSLSACSPSKRIERTSVSGSIGIWAAAGAAETSSSASTAPRSVRTAGPEERAELRRLALAVEHEPARDRVLHLERGRVDHEVRGVRGRVLVVVERAPEADVELRVDVAPRHER